MRDTLPKRGPWKRENAIVNLDSSSGSGTHWVCYHKRGNFVEYFDSYGDLPPPQEITKKYLAGNYISYNKSGYQSLDGNSEICGHLCLAFLSMFSDGDDDVK